MTILENKHMNKREAVKYAQAKGVSVTINDINAALQSPTRNAFSLPGQPHIFLKFLPLKNRVQVITAKIF